MLGFLIDNIFVFFGGHVFQSTVGIPMSTNCAPPLADLFRYSLAIQLDYMNISHLHKAGFQGVQISPHC